MKRGRVLCQLSSTEQLDVIAEGLPILLKSADELLLAAEALDGHSRAASIIKGHASEELAKTLILIDLVRCPPNRRPALVGIMFKWFYDHLARMIYADAQNWTPMTVNQLQEYINNSRKSHSLEGYAGEYILPNWTLYSRESLLYADIVTHEDGVPVWNEPSSSPPLFDRERPMLWEVVTILRDLGAFSRAGLDILSDVWGAVDFVGEQECYSTSNALISETIYRLDVAGLVLPAASHERVRWLYQSWQVPMYRIDFKRIEVTLEELKAAQDSALYAEMGIDYGDY
jgi:hypothetical protein